MSIQPRSSTRKRMMFGLEGVVAAGANEQRTETKNRTAVNFMGTLGTPPRAVALKEIMVGALPLREFVVPARLRTMQPSTMLSFRRACGVIAGLTWGSGALAEPLFPPGTAMAKGELGIRVVVISAPKDDAARWLFESDG